MPLRPASSFGPEPLPDLKHGIPGVEWHRDAQSVPPPPRPVMPSDDAESYRLYLWILFAVALILRLLVVFAGPFDQIETAYTPTTEHQLHLADNLVNAKAFAYAQQPTGSVTAALDQLRAQRGELSTVGNTDLHPELYTAPGYPFLLAAVRALTPELRWWLVVQCVLGALCVPVVYRLGRGMVGRKMPAALAAAVVAVHPAMLITPAALNADTVVALLALAGLWAVSNLETRSLRGAMGGGLALGVAALFTPAAAWLAPAAAAWVVATERRLRSVALAVALLIGTALPVGAWAYRSAQQGLDARPFAQTSIQRLFGADATASGSLDQEDRRVLAELEARLRVAPRSDTVLSVVGTTAREGWGADSPGVLATLAHDARRLLLTPAVEQAYARLGIDYAPTGYAADWLGLTTPASGESADAATGHVINGWVALNAALILAALVGAVLMLWRGRLTGLLLGLATLAVLIRATPSTGALALQPVALALLGLLAAATLAPGPLKVKRFKTDQLGKPRPIDDLPTTDRPMATAESLRVGRGPLPALSTGRGTATGTPSPAGRDDASLKHAVHPMLRPPETPDAPHAPATAQDGPGDDVMRPLMFSAPSGGGRPI